MLSDLAFVWAGAAYKGPFYSMQLQRLLWEARPRADCASGGLVRVTQYNLMLLGNR